MTSTNTVPIETATTRSGPRQASGWDAVKQHVPFAFVIWLAHLIVTQLAAYVSYRYGEMRSVRMVRADGTFVPDTGSDSRAYAS